MFEGRIPPFTITITSIVSTRDGWHGTPDLTRQDAHLMQLDPLSLSADEALSALVALQAHRARLDAIEVDLMVRSAGAARVVRDVLVECDDTSTTGAVTAASSRTIRLVDEVIDEIACALHRPFGIVHRQVQHSRLLVGPLGRTRAAVASGRITLAHAAVIAQQAVRMASGAPKDPDLDPEAAEAFAVACEALQDRVLPHAGRETVIQCRARARRAVCAIDAAAEARRRLRARLGCDVIAYGIDDGLAIIEARLPVTDAARIMAMLHERTTTIVANGTTTDGEWLARHGLESDATLGQLRVAALTEMLTGDGSTGSAAGVEVQVVIDAATLVGLNPDGAAWIQIGAGAPEACSRDDLLRLLADPGVHATMRRLINEPLTGSLIDRGAHRYAISESLTAWITARDMTCRFPGCTRRAVRCDVDHAEDFADGGRTTIANTGAMCRRHHNRKTHAGWRIISSRPDGSCVFISPTGRRYLHYPVELIPPPEPPPRRSSHSRADDPPGF